MITRQPQPGEVLEHIALWGKWEVWGTVERVAGDMVYCREKHFGIQWQFGHDGCLGNNAAFRIVESTPKRVSPNGEPVTMDDPAFN